MVRALAGTGAAGRMAYWAKCGQIRARSGRRREFSRSRDEGDGEGSRNGAATSGGSVSAGDGDRETERSPEVLGYIWHSLGVPVGRGGQGWPPGVGGYLRSSYRALGSGLGAPAGRGQGS